MNDSNFDIDFKSTEPEVSNCGNNMYNNRKNEKNKKNTKKEETWW